MYQSSYAEQLEDAPRECRDRERRAFDQVIEMLQCAEEEGASSSYTSVPALHFLCRLWRVLIEDLIASDNDLPDVLRGDLISIGIWVIKEAELIRLGRSINYRGLIEVCSIVRDGLK